MREPNTRRLLRRMVAAATMGPSIYLWEAATGKQRLMIKDAGYTTCLAFAPDGRILAVANDGLHSRIDGEKVVGQTDGRLIVRFLPWAMRDVKTPPYPERRAYVAAFRILCERAVSPGDLRLIVVRSRAPFARARPAPELFTCRR